MFYRLKWECITFKDGGGQIFNEHGKSAAARRLISMTNRVHAILSHRWVAAGEPLQGWVFPAEKAKVGHVVPNTIYQPHPDAVKQSGVRPFVLYSLRHTFLTRLGQSGCSPWTLAKIAGHSKTYVHASDDEASTAIKNMESSETKSKQNQKRRVMRMKANIRISRSLSKV